ncbi:LLM class flavin-dependent oxidoreductase [Streptomyces sp. NPDC004752]
MTADQHQVHLTVYLAGAGHHEAAWRFGQTQPERLSDIDYMIELAKVAESGMFDAVFIADSPYLYPDLASNGYYGVVPFEPFTLLSAISSATTRIGLIGTASTTYYEPFNLARLLASLDQISGGRAGWNIVTTSAPDASHNFGQAEHLEHDRRYERATEFMKVMTSLWDSWDDNAVVADRSTRQFLAPGSVRPIDHSGEWFNVRGPLTMPRTPQGHPVFAQAGSSDDGIRFGGRFGDVIFTSQAELDSAREFYTRMKQQARMAGREARDVKVLPGVVPILAPTVRQAQELRDELFAVTDVETALNALKSNSGGVDLTGYPLDEPFPDLGSSSDFNGTKSRRDFFVKMARERNLTLRQVLKLLSGGRGHREFVGTYDQFCDDMETWLHAGGADGFTILPPFLPGSLDEFVEEVVPRLQDRGLLRRAYSGSTLREHLGLRRPADQRV